MRQPSLPSQPTARKHIIAASLAIILLTGLLYGHTLSFPWHFDDERYLRENPLVTSAESFTFPLHFEQFIRSSESHGLHRDLWINFVLRPVSYATFHLNYIIDGFRPEGFRLVNIIIHALNGVLLLWLVWLLLGTDRVRSKVDHTTRCFIAVVSAFLFVAHPLHTESVTYIVQRFTSLAALFYLASLLLHIGSHHTRSSRTRWTLRIASAGVMLTGMLSKEITVTAPIMLLIAELLLLGSPFKTAVKNSILALCLLPVIPLMVLTTEKAFSGDATTLGDAMNIVEFTDDPDFQWHYLLTQGPVVMDYLRLLVLPTNQNVDPHVQLATSVTEPRVWISAICICLLVFAAAWAALRQLGDPLLKLAVYGVLWFFLTISVTCSIIPLPDLMAEHHTYLPAIGFAFLSAVGLNECAKRLRQHRWAAYVLAIVWVGALSAATVTRNEVWRSEVALWTDAATKSPLKPRPAGNLAVALHRQGDDKGCEEWLQRSLELGPLYKAGYLNLARFHSDDTKELSKALAVLDRGLALWPDDHELLYYRGLTLARMMDLSAAITTLKGLLQINPSHRGAHATMGEVYLKQSRPAEAIPHLRKAVQLGITSARIHAQLAELEKSDGVR